MENGDDDDIIYQNVTIVGKISSEIVRSQFTTKVIKNLKDRFLQESICVRVIGGIIEWIKNKFLIHSIIPPIKVVCVTTWSRRT